MRGELFNSEVPSRPSPREFFFSALASGTKLSLIPSRPPPQGTCKQILPSQPLPSLSSVPFLSCHLCRPLSGDDNQPVDVSHTGYFGLRHIDAGVCSRGGVIFFDCRWVCRFPNCSGSVESDPLPIPYSQRLPCFDDKVKTFSVPRMDLGSRGRSQGNDSCGVPLEQLYGAVATPRHPTHSVPFLSVISPAILWVGA